MRRIGRFGFAASVLLLLAAVSVSAQAFRFEIRADPRQLPANGISTSTISVVVYDTGGVRIPDSTSVNFVTTLGTIEPTSMLENGAARATLQSPTIPGVATVTAIIGAAREQVDVEFLPEGQATGQESRRILIKADYLSYGVDLRVLSASGETRLACGPLEITTDVKLELDVRRERLCAEGRPGHNGVKVTNGSKTITGDRLLYSLSKRQGTMLQVSPDPKRVYFHGSLLEEVDEKKGEEFENFVFDYERSGTWIVARRIVIWPGERVCLYRASVYLNDRHVLSLPVHVIPLNGGTAGLPATGLGAMNVLGFNSSGGLNLDFPFFYRANTSGTGAVRLRHNTLEGFSASQPGWSLALDEQYTFGDKAEGSLMAEGLTRPDWGLSFDHEQHFDSRTDGLLFLDFPRHEDLFARVSLSRDYRDYSVGLESFGTLPRDGTTTHSSRLYWHGRARPVGMGGWRYNWGTTLSYADSDTENAGNLSQSVDLTFYPPTWRWGDRTSLSSSLGSQVFHENGPSRFGASFTSSLSLNRQFSASTFMNVGYYFGQGEAAFGDVGTQYLTMNLYGARSRLSGSAYGTWTLDESSTFLSAELSYDLGRLWRVSSLTSFQDFGDSSAFTDHEITLGRALGGPFRSYELMLTWSKARNQFFWEIGTAR